MSNFSGKLALSLAGIKHPILAACPNYPKICLYVLLLPSISVFPATLGPLNPHFFVARTEPKRKNVPAESILSAWQTAGVFSDPLSLLSLVIEANA